MAEVSGVNLEPALLRIVTERLGGWLPVGPIRVVGAAADVEAGLLGLGYDLVTQEPPVAGVIFSEAREPSDIGAYLDDALAHTGRVPVCVVLRGASDQADRVEWESAMLCREWRKHPLNELVAPYGELDSIKGLTLAAFEPLSELAARAYPLQALEEERDLHTDMTREAGRRSDAHLARYAQASRFVRDGDRVIDVACGLGYGSYQIVRSTRAASVTGIDLSVGAVDYALVNFSGDSGVVPHYQVGDAQDLSGLADGSVDFAISIETLEHVPEPERLLSEIHRVLVPGGRLYASVPNDWSDESGEDPNPFHLHVYDWDKLSAQLRTGGFTIERAWLQDAGGGQKRHLVARSMLEVDPDRGPPCDGEWLLVLARKAVPEGERRAEVPAAAVTDMLCAGRREEAVAALMTLAEDTSCPLQRAASSVRLATLHSFSGQLQAARLVWEQSVDLLVPMLEESALRRDAANLLALAYDALDQDGVSMPTLFARHPAAMPLLGLETPDTVANLEDRAFRHGATDEFEPLGLPARHVREVLEAKLWLEKKYHEHTVRIAQLEGYNSQLEQARRWLDEQYHSLTDQVQGLLRSDTSRDS